MGLKVCHFFKKMSKAIETIAVVDPVFFELVSVQLDYRAKVTYLDIAPHDLRMWRLYLERFATLPFFRTIVEPRTSPDQVNVLGLIDDTQLLVLLFMDHGDPFLEFLPTHHWSMQLVCHV